MKRFWSALPHTPWWWPPASLPDVPAGEAASVPVMKYDRSSMTDTMADVRLTHTAMMHSIETSATLIGNGRPAGAGVVDSFVSKSSALSESTLTRSTSPWSCFTPALNVTPPPPFCQDGGRLLNRTLMTTCGSSSPPLFSAGLGRLGTSGAGGGLGAAWAGLGVRVPSSLQSQGVCSSSCSAGSMPGTQAALQAAHQAFLT
mmetsp:Transcript_21166/g.59542  ORF Transcript_21166/g.59542 Transcript_21166/m.59542 type:complete len:201 (+) Transcript_21166:420-1022(+)